MKKIIFIFFVFINICSLKSQDKNLLFGDSVIWFGIDFTKARFMGGFAEGSELGPNSQAQLVEVEIPRWNLLILKEPLKYNVAEASHKKFLFNETYSIGKINATINLDSVYSIAKDYKISDPDKTFNKMITLYDPERKKSGLGLVFVVEYFNDIKEQASVYAVFFDVAEKKVIAWKNLKGIAKGIGVRNHWGGSLKEIISQLKDFAYQSMVFQLKKK